MKEIKIIKGKTTDIIERDVNEFIRTEGNYNCYHNQIFELEDVKFIYNAIENIYIAMVIYSITNFG